MRQIRATIYDVRSGSSQAVSLWFSPAAGDTMLVSDVGAVESTVLPDYCEIPLPGSTAVSLDRQATRPARAGQSRTTGRAELVGSGHATAHDGSDLVSIRVDHIGAGDAADWLFRVVPVRCVAPTPAVRLTPSWCWRVWPD